MLGELRHVTDSELMRTMKSILAKEQTAFEETELDQLEAEFVRRGYENSMERDLR